MRDVTLRSALAVGLACAAAGTLHAQGTSEQREACAPDALKLCAATVPDIAKTAICMKAHLAELSPRCKAVIASDAPASGKPEAPPAARKAAPAERPVVRLAPRYHGDPDAEVRYLPPRRVIAPPRYSDPGPPLNPGGVPYDELFAGPSLLDLADGVWLPDDPYFD